MPAMLYFFYGSSDFEGVQNLWNRWYTGEEDLASWYIPFANWDGQRYLLLAFPTAFFYSARSWRLPRSGRPGDPGRHTPTRPTQS